MKWLLIAGVVVVAIIVLVVIVGTMLPRDHIARVTARVAGAPAPVWQTIADVADHAAWRTGVKRVELLPPVDGKTRWREHSSNGAILMIADRVEPPHRFVTRIADDKLPFGGTWEFVVEPSGDGASVVTITERGSVYNPVFRFMSRYVFGHTATMDAYLRSLGRKYPAA
jgi:hypothetical protein